MKTLNFSFIKHLVRSGMRYHIWNWAIILASVVICVMLFGLNFRQNQLLEQITTAITNLHLSRIDLTKGFLYVTLSSEPNAPYSREEGLILLQQAAASLDENIRNLDGVLSAEDANAFREDLDAFQVSLMEFRAADVSTPVLETKLRIAFHDLENQANVVDEQTHQQVEVLHQRFTLQFSLAFWFSLILLTAISVSSIQMERARTNVDRVLKESEARFRTVFFTNPAPQSILSLTTGRVLEVNEAICHLYGYNRDELIDADLEKLDLLVNPDEQISIIEELKTSGYLLPREITIRKKSREIRSIIFAAEQIVWNSETCLITTSLDITGRKHAEEKVKAEQFRFNQVAATVPGAITVFHLKTDGQMNISFASEVFEDIFGLKLSEIRSVESIIEKIPSEDIQQVLGLVQEASVSLQPVHFEFRYRHPLKGAIWLENRARPVRESDGSTAWYGLTTDITTRKKADEEWIKLSERLDLATQSAGIGIWDWDIQKNQLNWDDQMYALYGLKSGEFNGAYEAWLNGLHPDDRESSHEASAAAVRGEKKYDTEFRVLWPDGSVHWLKADGEVFRDEHGTPLRMVGINYEITMRKQAEVALLANEQRLRSLVESETHFVMRVDVDGHFTYWNHKYQNEFGWMHPQTNIADANPLDSICKHHHQRALDAVGQCIAQVGQIIRIELDKPARDGSIRTTLWEWVCLADENGRPSEIQCMGIEITERKQAEETVKKRLEDLALINKMNDAINQGESLAQITELIGEETTKIFTSRYASVYLIDPETHTLVLQNFTMPLEEVAKLEKLIGRTLPQIYIPLGGDDHYNQVMNSDQGMLITDKQAVERWLADFTLTTFLPIKIRPLIRKFIPAAIKLLKIGSVISIPLKAGDEVLGLIEFVTDGEFDVSTFERLQNVRHQLAEVIIRKRTEQSLRESNEKYRLLSEELEERVRLRTAEVQDLYENAPTGYHSLDTNGRFIRVNQTELNWLGYTRDELIGHPITEVLTSDSVKIFQEKFPVFKKTGLLNDLELEFIRKNGSIMPGLINAAAVYDGQGNYLMSRTTVFDNTNRKQAEQAVRESEETYRSLFESANDAIFLMDMNTQTYIRVNSRVPEVLGVRSTEELIGRNAFDFIDPSEVDQARDRLQALLQGDRLPPYERTFRRADGTSVRTEINLSLIRDSKGQPKFLQSVVRDITLRKQAEDALRESETQLRRSRDKLSAANIELERASRMKDEFLSSMSHELRTPLTGILGLSEALQFNTYGPLNERQTKALHVIEESGRHLLELINDILDLSKIEAGMFDLSIDRVPLNDVCQASLQLTKGMANKKKQSVRFSMEPPAIYVRGDGRRIKQMLVNLLSNAIKFTPEAGSLGLEVYGDQQEKVVRLTVWDNGIGIAAENLERLFQPFVQLESSLSRQYEGTGLGLSLVQRMAELQGGSVEVQSTPGEGSRFTILLPWQPEATQPTPTGAIKIYSASIKKALIVEDREIDAGQLTRYLHILGIESISHNTGYGVVELAEQEKPDLILIDLHLPDQSGFDVLADLKANPQTQNIPVIFCSVEERRSQSIALGAAEYLIKPLSFAELRTEINKVEAALKQNTEEHSSPISIHPTVLVVDDNEVAIETITDFLVSQNFQVAAAHSGAELLDTVANLRPNVILMDIQMPGMDGLEATRRIRAHPDPYIAQVPIIVVTALAMTGDRERCLEAGANEYLSKPIRLKYLLQTIYLLLDKHQKPK